jgi:transposase-like protein
MPEPRRKRPPSADPRYKMSDARVEAILAALRGGCTRRAAAAVGQINPSTLYEWMNHDPTLTDSIERAEAEAEAMFTAAVSRAAQDPKTWTAAAWWLERRKYQDYARRDKVEMTVDLRKEAEALAGELGLDPAAVMAELDGILKASR